MYCNEKDIKEKQWSDFDETTCDILVTVPIRIWFVTSQTTLITNIVRVHVSRVNLAGLISIGFGLDSFHRKKRHLQI